MYLINGQHQQLLPVSDRSVQFGDGCFTTARIKEGEVCQLEDHLRRLQQGCAALLIAPPDWHSIREEMRQLAAGEKLAVLKVIITRGAGGRGYSAANCRQPTRILSVSPYPESYSLWREQGIRLGVSPVRMGINPALAGIKHLNRLEQVLIRTHLEQTECQEALVLDSNGSLVECCAANLFWRQGRQVYTPLIDGAGVNGIMRQHIIACLESAGWPIMQVKNGIEALAGADEVIICNALMPVIPVNQAHCWHYSARELYQFLAPLCE